MLSSFVMCYVFVTITIYMIQYITDHSNTDNNNNTIIYIRNYKVSGMRVPTDEHGLL
jgi:hypothetical protein